MTFSFRQDQILGMIRDVGRVTVEDLAAEFGVTHQTIRRDLTTLSSLGHVTRVHGGAIIPSGRVNIGYTTRRHMAAEGKAAIGERAAAEIPDNCSIFINIGTTTEAVARALVRHRNIMAITNNLNVANILMENEACEVIVAGGVLRRTDGGLVGETTAEFFQQFKVDFAIIGASAIDEDGSLLDFDVHEVRVAKAILANARTTLLVADRTKFERQAPVRIARIEDLETLICDSAPPAGIRDLCAARDVRLLIADSGETEDNHG